MFWLYKNDNGHGVAPDSVSLPRATGAVYAAGTALTLKDGVAVPAAGVVKPSFICCSSNEANDGSELLGYSVSPTMLFEVPLTAFSDTVKPGAKVTLSADGKGVTATTEGGVATVIDLQGAKAVGDKIIVKFE